jgi:hypothetical protein
MSTFVFIACSVNNKLWSYKRTADSGWQCIVVTEFKCFVSFVWLKTKVKETWCVT